MSKTIFEKIVDREIPAQIIWEDEKHLAFLDINPLLSGHTLVIPKKNVGDYLFDLKNNDYDELMTACKVVATLLKTKLECNRVFVAVEGLEVPHVHVHLIPSDGNINLGSLKKNQASQKDLEAIKSKIVN